MTITNATLVPRHKHKLTKKPGGSGIVAKGESFYYP